MEFLCIKGVTFLASIQWARIKEPLFLWPGCRQLPPPRSCQRAAHLSWHCSWYVIPGHGLPQPLSPQTTVSFSSASSDLRALTQLSPQPPSVERHSPLFFFPQALDGAGPTQEQPQPDQQCFHCILPEQPERQGPSTLLGGIGRREALGCAVPFPSCGFCAFTETASVKGENP